MCGEINFFYKNKCLVTSEDVYDSLINYNAVHLNNGHFENLYLLNEIQNYKQLQQNEEIYYGLGIIISIYTIYKFVCEIIKSLSLKYLYYLHI
jgi:hypothetical protein